eukprot:2903469-Prymnesium_polylepis.1
MPPFCAAQMSHAFRSGGVGARATARDIGKPSHASRFTWPCQSVQGADVIRSVHPLGTADVVHCQPEPCQIRGGLTR